jgi:hypothetical protein
VDLGEWCLLGVRNGHRGRLLIAQALAYWRVSSSHSYAACGFGASPSVIGA